MKVVGIRVSSPEEALRVKWILGIHAGAAACGGISLAWLVILILFTSHEGECGGYEVQHKDNLGLWHTARSESFYIGYVCERSAQLGCLEGWSEFQGSCYIRVCDPKTYSLAQEGCAKRAASLTSISSAEENEHVLSLCGRQSCWIGLSRPRGAKMWQWADGTSAGWFGNWSTFSKFAPDAVESLDRACLNKGPPERMIEEPVFIVKAVGKFVIPAFLLFVAYLALKRRSTDLAGCLCIVDGFFAACLFAEVVLLILRYMKGDPWIDIFSYLLFMVFASCGLAFCCACSARAFTAVRALVDAENGDDREHEREGIMKSEPMSDVDDTHPSSTVKKTAVAAGHANKVDLAPQSIGNRKQCTEPRDHADDGYDVEADGVPQLPMRSRSVSDTSSQNQLTHL